MTIGANGGHQLNIFVMEVGTLSRLPMPDGSYMEIPATIGIHPLVVAPTSIRYTDTSRSSVESTQDGFVVNVAGRAGRRVSFQGTFGVESRGIALYIGTGELRFQKFMHEVVRLPDAISQTQVDAEKDLLRSPLLNLALNGYVEEFATFYINFYDFWNDVKFQVRIPNFSWTRSARQGGAVGLVSYTMEVEECGEIVTGTIGGALINGIFEALTTWTKINTLIASYTPGAIVDSIVSTADVIRSQFDATCGALSEWANSATALMNGGASTLATSRAPTPPPTTSSNTFSPAPLPSAAVTSPVSGSANPALPTLFALSEATIELSASLIETLRNASASADGDATLQWKNTWPPLPEVELLGVTDEQDQLHALTDAAAAQQAIGALYGMSVDEYREFIGSMGAAGVRPDRHNTRRRRVQPWDTLDSIAAEAGVDVETLVRTNGGASPVELLLPGTEILVPQRRAAGGPSRIDGLPVFGSHTGAAALGSDMRVDLGAGDDSGFGRVTEAEALQQGIDWLIQTRAPAILKLLSEFPDIPEVQERMLKEHVGRLVASDRRVVAVSSVRVDNSGDGHFTIQVDAEGLAGINISTGG
jgi:hypothetical protein